MAKLKWLTNAATELTTDTGKVITFDPCVRFMAYGGIQPEDYTRPDYVLVSHLHWDHIADIRYLYNTYTPTVLCGQQSRRELTEYLSANPAHIYPAYVNVGLDFGDFRVKPLYAIHRDLKKRIFQASGTDLSKIDGDIAALSETGTLEMTNYLLTLPNGLTVLFWGGAFDEVQKNMLRGLKPDVAVMQYSPAMPDKFNEIAEAIQPGRIIPYHHDFSLTEEQWKPLLTEYRKLCCYPFEILENGQEISL